MRAEGEHVRHIVAGIGINVNLSVTDMPPEIAAIATSLSIAAGHTFDRLKVLDAILASLDTVYRRWLSEGFAALLPDIAAFDVLRDRPVTIDRGSGAFTGIACGIAPDGALLVRRDDGTVEPVYSGDAHISHCRASVSDTLRPTPGATLGV
jgi:BirA family biotin operon repressor/biotin-[acetyl-CoA-carboxylase] ligase